ncbi:MAG TPA: DcaP family trimeric outer membrane transporter [Anaeromyxobacteraceae bacterium]|nr:DcaP family trimeric outer membrane transporter [Anaeromyxobacteraceae bacterium]
MTRARFSSVLAAACLALPLAAGAQDQPGVFKVPGTDSTIKFYGYVQLDGTVDFSGRPTDIENYDWATILPAVPLDNSVDAKRKPQTYLTARTSRFGIQTNTPTAAGPVGVRLEGDFNGPNGFQSETFTNSVLFRLRHAYGTFGGLLVGQTWTTFLDLGAAPDTVDFNGPGSLALVRNPMLRYTFGLAPTTNLVLAIENNRGLQYGWDGTFPVRFQMIPDIHLNLTFSGGWGHVSVRGVAQDYVRQVQPAGPGSETNKSKFSLSGAVSGSLKLGGDTLVAQVSGGPGIGRYMLNALGAPFVTANAATNYDIELWTAFAYHVGFTHVWNPQVRSNLVWSQTFITDPEIGGVPAAPGTFEKDMMQAFVNTFYGFAKNCEFGAEYVFGQYKMNVSGEKGTQNRINFSFHYNFY